MNEPLKAAVCGGAIVVETYRDILNPDDRISLLGRIIDPTSLPQTIDRGQPYLVTVSGGRVPFLNKEGARIWVTI